MRLATRGSALALAQAKLVAAELEALGARTELVVVRTSGDEGGPRHAVPEDKSRFVKEIEEALLDGRADLAVHSAKDVPAELPDGLAIAGVPARADARDALCGAASLDELPEGASVGTASLRRRAQLLAARPDLDVRDVRGNVDTRLGKLADGEFDAIVLAAAGLARLGRASEGSPVDPALLVPAAGQGCLALEARADRDDVRELAARLTERDALVCLTAERAAVATLGATCRTPVAAYARCEGDRLRLAAFAGRSDGSAWARDEAVGDPSDPAGLGAFVGERLLAVGADALVAG